MVRSLWSAATGMNAQQTNVDTISNNLLSFSENLDSGDMIRVNRDVIRQDHKKANKSVFNISILYNASSKPTDTYENVADHSNIYYIPTKNSSFNEYQDKVVESERIRRVEYKMRLRHANADIRSLNDIREKRIAHIRNMHNPLTK